jgi:hypothetical protein
METSLEFFYLELSFQIMRSFVFILNFRIISHEKTEYVQIQNCKFERYKNSFKLQI